MGKVIASLKERVDTLPRMSLEYPSEFIIEVKHRGQIVGELLIQLNGMTHTPATQTMNCGLWITNLRTDKENIDTIQVDV